MASSTGELLAVLVDASRPAWRVLGEASAAAASASPPEPARATFPEFLTALELFLAAVAACNRHASIAVFAFNGEAGGYVFPPLARGGGGATRAAEAPGAADILRPAVLRKHVRAGLVHLAYGAKGVEALAPECAPAAVAVRSSLDGRCRTLAACFSQAILWINRHQKAAAPPSASGASSAAAAAASRQRARILVFQASPDVPVQYIPLINGFFTAQRMGAHVDSCLLGRAPSVYLQQAAHLTGGQHLHPAERDHGSLLTYLLTLLLPDVATRNQLLTPPAHGVNLRAHCFCHKAHRDVAWLCTVCLSLWCDKLATCPICGTGDEAGGGAARTGGAAALGAPPAAGAAGGGAGCAMDIVPGGGAGPG